MNYHEEKTLFVLRSPKLQRSAKVKKGEFSRIPLNHFSTKFLNGKNLHHHK